ncbi:FAD-dependent monooxygenase [Bosea sp. RAC05]|jgi:2-polyprenyl-6-methoxyphenol hydroxylase-like FAD-dependent oxidoreductase|uniref:FAD-dependent monooxygenase n=1 Tax=Bosea sp. RAC05 TaxID=1842539 RepID=UPI00085784AF|nr:FHA domain-containing protein [Bosea sp. RAC05]AOG06536.1 FAD binding domain protein [Bosea sp. RAC05]
MKSIVNLGRDFANSVADLFGREAAQVEPKTSPGRRRILVVGGGPAGLAFATSLHAIAGAQLDLTIADARWIEDGRVVRWRNVLEGVNRREQVVTIQSLVFDRLAEPVRSAMFPAGGYAEVWPLSRESPAERGFPRNVRIRDLEDRLLELARAQGLRLLAKRVEPDALRLEDWDLVVIADGANSRVRDHFTAAFGRADHTPYALRGSQVVDNVLGLRVTSLMSETSSVIMTIAQQRYLFNGIGGDGLLYMRLTDDEAAEVRGRVAGKYEFRPCLQANPCQVTWRANNVRKGFYCAGRGSQFVPADDPNSYLWKRLLEGLALFGIPKEALVAVTTFPLSMSRRGAFSAQLNPIGSERTVFGALIGDAAGVTHFWPGRGLNRGLSSAYALAVVLSRLDPAAPLRSADFAEFEGIMAQLQSRHQDRAWRAMVQMRGERVLPIKEIIRDAIAQPRASREILIRTMQVRVAELVSGLTDRLPIKPDLTQLFAALDRVDDETLAVLVESRGWETRESGGPEIDVEALLRVSKREP